MKLKIKDIARYAGVSSATISNVLNNKTSKVSEETRIRILKAFEELNYKPNVFARGLIHGKSNTIGVIMPDISKAHFSVLVTGIEAAANKAGYKILICNAYNRIEKEQEYYQMLSGKGVDGIIIAAGEIHESYHKFSFSPNKPIIMIDRHVEGLDDQYGVYVDNFQGTYLGTKYLIELGHTQIGCITGPIRSNNTRERIKGYRKAMLEHGLRIEDAWLFSGNHELETGIAGFEQMIKNTPTSAIVACGDLLSYGVYKAAAIHQLKIPDDISVIGVDDNIFSELITPKLTALRPPLYQIGVKAVHMLHSQIQNKKLRKRQITYLPELIVRDSTKTRSF